MTMLASEVGFDSVTSDVSSLAVVHAHAALERGRFSWFWVVPNCPFCGKLHDHYAGPLQDDPDQYLGLRFPARCDETDRRQMGLNHDPSVLWYVLVPMPE